MRKEFDETSRSFFLYGPWDMCGLRPRIKRHSCTFGRRLVPKKMTQFPRSYGRIMQPIYKLNRIESNFPQFCLQMCIFCCTFAA